MKKLPVLLTLLCVFVPLAAQQTQTPPQTPQTQTEPEHKLREFQMALLKRGPNVDRA